MTFTFSFCPFDAALKEALSSSLSRALALAPTLDDDLLRRTAELIETDLSLLFMLNVGKGQVRGHRAEVALAAVI